MRTQTQNLLLALAIFAGLNQAIAQGTAFTYQGRLNDGSAPANGIYDLQFTIYDAGTSGSPVAGPLTNSATAVSNGLFTVALDFGADAFTGVDRWLEIGVRTNGTSSNFTTLSPRQEILSTPYAIQAANANSVAASNILGAVSTAQLPGVVVTNGAGGLNLSGAFSGNGAGLTNLSASALPANVALLNGNQTFSGSNVFTQTLTLSNAAPVLRIVGPGQTGARATLDLTTYDPGTNAPSARIQTTDNNWGSDWNFLGKQPGAATNSLVSLLHISNLGDLSNPGYIFSLGTISSLSGIFSSGNITAAGNVGIGTTAPTVSLQVNGSGWFGPGTNAPGPTSGTGMRVFYDYNHGAGSILAYDYSDNYPTNLTLQAAGGNVGIGTLSPQFTLDVNGDVRASVFHGDGSQLTGLTASQVPNLDGSKVTSGTIADARLSANVALLNASQNFTSQNTFAGNVGIGTLNPQFPLDVNGDVRASIFQGDGSKLTGLIASQIPNLDGSKITSGTIVDARLSANVALLNASQNFTGQNTFASNVGIGTNSPNYRLSLGGDNVNTKLALWEGGGTAMGFGVAASQFRIHLPDSGNRFSFLDNPGGSNELMTIQGTGNVGIGITNPASRLQVLGNIQLGSAGTNYAASGTENLRIVRGALTSTGVTKAGIGFSVTAHPSAGSYTITFAPPFSGVPTLTVTARTFDAHWDPAGATASAAQISIVSSSGTPTDDVFSFIAVGPP